MMFILLTAAQIKQLEAVYPDTLEEELRRMDVIREFDDVEINDENDVFEKIDVYDVMRTSIKDEDLAKAEQKFLEWQVMRANQI